MHVPPSHLKPTIAKSGYIHGGTTATIQEYYAESKDPRSTWNVKKPKKDYSQKWVWSHKLQKTQSCDAKLLEKQ